MQLEQVIEMLEDRFYLFLSERLVCEGLKATFSSLRNHCSDGLLRARFPKTKIAIALIDPDFYDKISVGQPDLHKTETLFVRRVFT
jgi:hypothetical protein